MNLELTFERPVFFEQFHDYRSYTDYIKDVLGRTFQNAADPRRLYKYSPLATMSSGYHSPTIAVWAKSQGCQEAVISPNLDGEAMTVATKSRRDSGLR